MLNSNFFRKIEKTAKKFKLNTQRIRAQLILDLKVLAEMAHDRAVAIKERGRPAKEHQKWAKLAAYIARSINIIAKEYDLMKIKEKLDELKRMVEELERNRGKTT
jgi:hypothetical protein